MDYTSQLNSIIQDLDALKSGITSFANVFVYLFIVLIVINLVLIFSIVFRNGDF